MKRVVGVALIGITVTLSGCSQQPAAGDAQAQRLVTSPTQNSGVVPADPAGPVSASAQTSGEDRVVARVSGEPITVRQLMQPLIESHGLQILMGLVQLDQAKQDVRSQHLTVTPDDIRNEQEMTLAKMFKDADAKEQDELDQAEAKKDADKAKKLREQIASDREQLLTQYLDNQHFSRTEFNLKMEINAYLRKLAEPLLRGKITDALVEKEFGVEYGETARVRIIQLSNMKEVAQARERLKKGDDFGDVSQDMSRNARTAAMRGEMAPFSRQTPGLPDTLKEIAFSLEPGQVSDNFNYGGNFYILKLEQKFPPKAVKFENVKESIRKNMYDRVVQATIEQLDRALGAEALQHLQVEDPALSAQLKRMQAQQEAEIHNRQQIAEQWKRERPTQPATAPAASAPSATEPAGTGPSAPVTAPATQP